MHVFNLPTRCGFGPDLNPCVLRAAVLDILGQVAHSQRAGEGVI